MRKGLEVAVQIGVSSSRMRKNSPKVDETGYAINVLNV